MPTSTQGDRLIEIKGEKVPLAVGRYATQSGQQFVRPPVTFLLQGLQVRNTDSVYVISNPKPGVVAIADSPSANSLERESKAPASNKDLSLSIFPVSRPEDFLLDPN